MNTIWKDQFIATLKDFLKDPSSEEVRERCYELGRQAIEQGLGILDLAALQQAALEELLYPHFVGQVLAGKAKETSHFLAEIMAPYEMLIRGFREANQNLQVANQELESFNYSIAHDLRAPLRSLSGFAEILLEDYAGQLDEKGKSYLGQIKTSAQQMSGMIEALLGLARLGRALLRTTELDLSAVAKASLQTLQVAEPQRKVEAVVKENMWAYGDPTLLKMVLDNLLGNAWKFSAKNPHARVEFGREVNSKIVYYVRDNGAGFNPQQASRLFQPFQRLHAASEFEGHGIGLATVQRIIQRHGGQIWAESVPGQGATFFFTLGPKGNVA